MIVNHLHGKDKVCVDCLSLRNRGTVIFEDGRIMYAWVRRVAWQCAAKPPCPSFAWAT